MQGLNCGSSAKTEDSYAPSSKERYYKTPTGVCSLLRAGCCAGQGFPSPLPWFSLPGTAGCCTLTVSLAVYATFFERHDVLRKRSCLIGEDVVDLPQLLVQRGGSGLRCRVLLRIVHLQVPVYKIALAQTNHFDAK